MKINTPLRSVLAGISLAALSFCAISSKGQIVQTMTPIQTMSTSTAFQTVVNQSYVWNSAERTAYLNLIAKPRFTNATTAGNFSITNVDQLRILKDALDMLPTSRALDNNYYEAILQSNMCTIGNVNFMNYLDGMDITYRVGRGVENSTGDPYYPFSVALNSPCVPSTQYALVVNENATIGFGTSAPQTQYHFAVPSFQIGDATQLQFKITNTTGSESMIFSKAGYDLFKVNKDGKVFAREFEVTVASSTFPDYVFAKDYKLRSLPEVETFIQANKHLPGFEPAATYEKEGTVNVGELQLKLLEKVEELTLYVIQQQKEIEALKAQVATQK